MASSSRETPVNQQISGLTVTKGAKLYAGTVINTTKNNIYNGWSPIPKYWYNFAIKSTLRSTQSGSLCCQGRTKYGCFRYHLSLRLFFLYLNIAKGQTPSYYKVPNRRVGGFVGWEDILQKIDEALSDGAGPHYAVLQGIGGQGKSQVALGYCRRKKDNPYSAISKDTAKRSFQSISERIKCELIIYLTSRQVWPFSWKCLLPGRFDGWWYSITMRTRMLSKSYKTSFLKANSAQYWSQAGIQILIP